MPHTVWYIEWRDPTAQQVLTEWLNLLPTLPGFVGAEVQVSPAQPGLMQPGLALLVSRWEGTPPELSVPHGAKHWMFEVVAEVMTEVVAEGAEG